MITDDERAYECKCMINWRMETFKDILNVLNTFDFSVNSRLSDAQIKEIRTHITNMNHAIDTIEYHQRKLSNLIDSGAV